MPMYTYQGWNAPSLANFESAYVTPCDRCRLTDCHSIHDYAAPVCHLELCEVCADFSELDQQISALQDQLISLVRKRWAMKSKFNDRHDQLTRHLPMEIISDIFLFVAASTDPLYDAWFTKYPNRSPLLLGSICKKWRDITIGLPKLWCALDIKPWHYNFSLKSMKEWLQRSLHSPLSVVYHGTNTSQWGAYPSRPYRKDPHLLNLLRSQANRWKHFTFTGSWKILHDLLHNIDNVLSLNTLEIRTYWGSNISFLEEIRTREPMCPKELIIDSVPLRNISIQWNNLTHLDASSICLDEILHVIHHGTKLVSCMVGSLLESASDTSYPLPTKLPLVHQAMSHLRLDKPLMEYSEFLPYLTLPHLTTFGYQSRRFDLVGLDNLVDFFHRSRPPLQEFAFEVDLGGAPIPWCERLSMITSLKVCIYQNREPEQATNHFFRALTSALNLPYLRQLHIITDIMSKESWSIFCDIFQATEQKNTASVIVVSDVSEATESLRHQKPVDERYQRPLESVYLQRLRSPYWPYEVQCQEIADEDIYFKLLGIKGSGFRLDIMDEYGTDLFECATRLIAQRQLPFSVEMRPQNDWPGDGWGDEG